MLTDTTITDALITATRRGVSFVATGDELFVVAGELGDDERAALLTDKAAVHAIIYRIRRKAGTLPDVPAPRSGKPPE
jgi:hypothetical protein